MSSLPNTIIHKYYSIYSAKERHFVPENITSSLADVKHNWAEWDNSAASKHKSLLTEEKRIALQCVLNNMTKTKIVSNKNSQSSWIKVLKLKQLIFWEVGQPTFFTSKEFYNEK